MTSSAWCHQRRRHPPQDTQMINTKRHDSNLSPGHLTKVLTNFSIDSIIGEQKLASKEFKAAEDVNAQASNQASNQKKFRPKNFACLVCRMAFSNNGQLKNHVRIHTGERPFQCNQTGCNKTFTRNEELTRHKLIHTGVRPHACPSCCKSFGRKDHLKKHVRTHERKRIRKRVYVPAAPCMRPKLQNVEGDTRPSEIIDPVFSPSKRRPSSSRPGGRLNPKGMISSSLSATSTAQMPLSPAALPLAIDELAPIAGYDQFNTPYMPPVTLAQNFNQLIGSDSAARTMASLAVTNSLSLCRPPASVAAAASTGAALQQLAGDYWHKWYSFLGLCHQQQQQQHQQQQQQQQQQQTISSSKRV